MEGSVLGSECECCSPITPTPGAGGHGLGLQRSSKEMRETPVGPAPSTVHLLPERPPSGAHGSEARRQNGHSVLWDYKGLVWLPEEWGWGAGLGTWPA